MSTGSTVNTYEDDFCYKSSLGFCFVTACESRHVSAEILRDAGEGNEKCCFGWSSLSGTPDASLLRMLYEAYKKVMPVSESLENKNHYSVFVVSISGIIVHFNCYFTAICTDIFSQNAIYWLKLTVHTMQLKLSLKYVLNVKIIKNLLLRVTFVCCRCFVWPLFEVL